MSGHAIDEDLSKPLWKYVTKSNKFNEKSGNIFWQCNFCNAIKTSSYTRVRAYLLKLQDYGSGACKKLTMKDICKMQKPEDEAKFRMQTKARKRMLLSSNNMSSKNCYVLEEKKWKNNTIENAFNLTTCDQLELVTCWELFFFKKREKMWKGY